MTTPATYVVGYHQIHADVSLNYQMNRFSTGTDDMIAEMRDAGHGSAITPTTFRSSSVCQTRHDRGASR
jgi:hypothetical protein